MPWKPCATMTDAPVVLVTGAAQRIGAAIAMHFHLRGYRVLVHYRASADAANTLVSQLNAARADSAHALCADLCDAQQVSALGEAALSQFDRIDVLINNASTFYPTPIGTATPADWDTLIDSNLRAAFFLSQALADELRLRQGAIVNLIDTHADKPLARHAIYSVAKAGLKAMTKSLAQELAPQVRVNGVAPGAILWPAALEDDSDPVVKHTRDKILQQIPAGQLGTPEQIAAAVFFVATEAHYMTGATLRVDGGRHLA